MQRISRVASYNALSAIANYEIQQEKFMTQGEFECALKTVPLYGALLNGTWLEPFGAGKDLYFETSTDLASNSNTGGNFREYFGAGAGVVSTLAQGFQPTSTDSLHNATFRFCTVLPGNKKVVIQIRDQECGRPGPRILAEDSVNFTTVCTPGNSFDTRTVKFSNKPGLIAGRQYYFVMNSSNGVVGIKKSPNPYFEGDLNVTYNTPISYPIDDKLSSPVMKKSGIVGKMDELVGLLDEVYHVNMSYDVLKFNLSQNNESGPWFAILEFHINYTINSSTAYWQENRSASTKVSLLGLPDPYITIMTRLDGLDYQNTITYEFANGSAVDTTYANVWQFFNVTEFLKYHPYNHETRAPSYFMRFFNDMTSSLCCGIESPIWFQNYITNITFFDYCFWSGICPSSIPFGEVSLYTVNGITNSSYIFLIEPYHAVKYNLTGYLSFYTDESTGDRIIT